MKVTSVRLRYIKSNHILCIASVTLNNQLIINDIKVLNENNEYVIRLPNTEFAQKNQQYSLVPQADLYNDIKSAIINKIQNSKEN